MKKFFILTVGYHNLSNNFKGSNRWLKTRIDLVNILKKKLPTEASQPTMVKQNEKTIFQDKRLSAACPHQRRIRNWIKRKSKSEPKQDINTNKFIQGMKKIFIGTVGYHKLRNHTNVSKLVYINLL